MTQWRFAWVISGVAIFLLSQNAGFLLFGVLILLLEQMADSKNKGHKIKDNSAWYGFWWVAYAMSMAVVLKEYEMAIAVLVCFAITAIAIEKYKGVRRSQSKKHNQRR